MASRGRRSADIPSLVKVAPDLTEPALEDVIRVCSDAGAEGLIKLIDLPRDGLAAGEPLATESGGLLRRSTHQTGSGNRRFLAQRTKLPIIGVAAS